jgi:hypothetical protein
MLLESIREVPMTIWDQYAVSPYLSSIRGSVTSKQRKPLVPYYQNANREFTLFGSTRGSEIDRLCAVDTHWLKSVTLSRPWLLFNH